MERLVAAAEGDARARNKVSALERDFELLVNRLDELDRFVDGYERWARRVGVLA